MKSKVFKWVGVGIGGILVAYIIASLALSFFWWSNYGTYDGSRYGLTVVELFKSTVTTNYTESGERVLVVGDNGAMGFVDSGSLKPGDVITSFSIYGPFNKYTDSPSRVFHLKVGEKTPPPVDPEALEDMLFS